MTKNMGWKAADVHDIPPIKDSWAKGWHSVRHFFEITGFGVNAATKNAGQRLTPEHDELGDNQQELFVVMEGKVEFGLDKKSFIGTVGCMLSVEPQVKRSAKALETPTTLLIVGGTPGKAYKVQGWEKV